MGFCWGGRLLLFLFSLAAPFIHFFILFFLLPAPFIGGGGEGEEKEKGFFVLFFLFSLVVFFVVAVDFLVCFVSHTVDNRSVELLPKRMQCMEISFYFFLWKKFHTAIINSPVLS